MSIRNFVGLLAVAFVTCCMAGAADPVAGIFGELAATNGLNWMHGSESGSPISFPDAAGGMAFDVSASHEIIARDERSGRVLRQVQQWLPDIQAYRLVTRAGKKGATRDKAPVNVADWAFQFPGRFDGAYFQALTHSKDTWYGSSYWNGPDWTRVGKDWQHPGEKTSSVRLFTVPSDGAVTISGNVCKADTNGGDGVRVSIRHNAEVVWQQDIGPNDAQGVDPAIALEVRKGDRLRFVVHRREAIPCDTTHWDPVVTYADGHVFRASDAFGAEPKAGWAYEMEISEEAPLPRVYALDRHFCLHERTITPGGEITLDSDTDLPLFILADEHDAGGIAGAVIDVHPWQFLVSLNERGRLSIQIRSKAGHALPEIVVAPYKGAWIQAAAWLEQLHRSGDTARERAPFCKSIDTAFRDTIGALDSRARPELDLWAEVQWDWHRQDALEDTPQGYEAAIQAVVRKTAELAGDLGVPPFMAAPSSTDEPCLRYLRAHVLRRRIALANPRMDFGKLLFCKRVPTSYSHLVMQYYGWRARPGGGLFVLDEPGYSFSSHDIFNGALAKGNLLEPRLSYDAQRVVFSYVESAGTRYDIPQLDNKTDEGFYHLWETNVDGTGLHPFTQGPYDDLMPTYLPDGGIAFSSTRRGGYARCFGPQFSSRWHVYALHRVEPDGRNLRALSFHDTNEWFPAVSNAGIILYSRWDYIDRDAVTHQTLWGTRPDGTNPMAIWGNASPKPHCTFQMQPIPESRKIVFTASAHHSITGGPIVVLDPEVDNNAQEALTRITPGIPFPEAESADIREYYEAPWPLSEKYFLASYSPWPLVWEPGANPPNALGIYLIDVFGNRELIYRDPVIGSTNAVPLAARPVPPILPSSLPAEPADQGEAVIADVYQGLGGMPRDSVKTLRVIQIFPKSTPVAGTPPIGLAGEENARAVLGEVPIEPDGSAHFAVPARKPLLFQLLDEHGFACQTMRSVTYLQPGEKVSCIGCHEPQKTAAANAVPAAARRSASAITPGPFENEPFSYPLVVQPVLEKYCVRCHSGPEPCGKKNLADTPLNGYSQSYWALCGDADFAGPKTNPETAATALVPRFGARNQVQMTPPGGTFGARGSRLLHMLQEGHHEVRLERDALRRLAQWIDCNAIFYGGYSPEDQASQLRGDHLPMPALQ